MYINEIVKSCWGSKDQTMDCTFMKPVYEEEWFGNPPKILREFWKKLIVLNIIFEIEARNLPTSDGT